jgi:hypothetical protein
MRFIRRRFLFPAILGYGTLAPVAAADPADMRLAMEARKSLNADEKLAALNLGVMVRNGEATLYGPVPSEELARRAELRVRVVGGLRNVFNDLHVAPPDDPVLKKLADALEKLDHSPSALPGPVTTLDPSGHAMTPPTPRFLPTAPASSLFSLAKSIDQPAMIAPAWHRPALDPTKDIESLCRRDQRFRGLQVKCEKGVVSIDGLLKKWPDLWEFADVVSRLPGVERIRIEGVKLEK